MRRHRLTSAAALAAAIASFGTTGVALADGSAATSGNSVAAHQLVDHGSRPRPLDDSTTSQLELDHPDLDQARLDQARDQPDQGQVRHQTGGADPERDQGDRRPVPARHLRRQQGRGHRSRPARSRPRRGQALRSRAGRCRSRSSSASIGSRPTRCGSSRRRVGGRGRSPRSCAVPARGWSTVQVTHARTPQMLGFQAVRRIAVLSPHAGFGSTRQVRAADPAAAGRAAHLRDPSQASMTSTPGWRSTPTTACWAAAPHRASTAPPSATCSTASAPSSSTTPATALTPRAT